VHIDVLTFLFKMKREPVAPNDGICRGHKFWVCICNARVAHAFCG
jgi:hypothetical protein